MELAGRYFFRRSNAKPSPMNFARGIPLYRALVTHFGFVGVAILLHCYATAVVWLAAAALIFPFWQTLRQVLEHRAGSAKCSTDFRQVQHGPINRIFEGGFFSRYYGAAGFNRHLLHHWDPTVSYTRFNEMEAFFNCTTLAGELRASRSTYFATFILLLGQSFRDPS